MACGPLTAAISSRPAHRPVSSVTAAAGAATEAIAPCPASAVSARDRSATTRAPSSSERIPATTAAAISPWE